MMQPGCPSATRALACECERAFVRARDQERTRACADRLVLKRKIIYRVDQTRLASSRRTNDGSLDRGSKKAKRHPITNIASSGPWGKCPALTMMVRTEYLNCGRTQSKTDKYSSVGRFLGEYLHLWDFCEACLRTAGPVATILPYHFRVLLLKGGFPQTR